MTMVIEMMRSDCIGELQRLDGPRDCICCGMLNGKMVISIHDDQDQVMCAAMSYDQFEQFLANLTANAMTFADWNDRQTNAAGRMVQ